MDSSVDRIATGAAIDELRDNPELARVLLEAAQATPRTTGLIMRMDVCASWLSAQLTTK